ncbi:hypothetical protein WOLCODRAFT_29631 [Wolfiporia cocos MD-104 SS10]|uniref:Uncharacterized protein n=1 Tax=Wolfiporia cocos (strain MD-104) TaxID=742152 RepID=A0A2H3JI90_WOLCO|nr:hypothetical protein WOLCODRAFT_29631 [Wolfiporia cocos MD-104 SS10]
MASSTVVVTKTESASGSQPVLTTTLFSGTPLPTDYYDQHPKSTVPVGAIAGGAAAGVFLAVAMVVIWVWWGKSIKRENIKKQREALAKLQVKENTRRNASSGTYTQFPPSFVSSRHERKVSFVPSPAPSATSTLRVPKEEAQTAHSAPSAASTLKDAKEAPCDNYSSSLATSIVTHKPVRPSPLGRSSSTTEQAPLLTSPSPHNAPALSMPTTPRHSPVASRSSGKATPSPTGSPTSTVQPFLKRPLTSARSSSRTNRASAASTASVYSTESGEERQTRVSSSLIMAALGHMDPRRSWLGNYLGRGASRHRTSAGNDLEQRTLSRTSILGVDDAEEGVGLAYGGEEGMGPS